MLDLIHRTTVHSSYLLYFDAAKRLLLVAVAIIRSSPLYRWLRRWTSSSIFTSLEAGTNYLCPRYNSFPLATLSIFFFQLALLLRHTGREVNSRKEIARATFSTLEHIIFERATILLCLCQGSVVPVSHTSLCICFSIFFVAQLLQERSTCTGHAQCRVIFLFYCMFVRSLFLTSTFYQSKRDRLSINLIPQFDIDKFSCSANLANLQCKFLRE